MNPDARIPLLAVLILVGCTREPGSDEAPALDNPAVAAPTPGGPAGAGAGPAEEAAPVATEFVAGVDHPFFPLTPGTFWTYEGEDAGLARREEIRALEPARVISGVACTAVRQEVFLGGELAEVTTEWFAQDLEGNVWKFGEETLEFDGQQFAATEDSWVAGVDGAVPWMTLAADPLVGDRYVGHPPGGQETIEVLSLTETATVPAGTFENCLQVVENADDPADADLIIYGPGVGLVSEQSSTGRIDLVETGRE